MEQDEHLKRVAHYSIDKYWKEPKILWVMLGEVIGVGGKYE